MHTITPTIKTVGRWRGTRTEIELHGFRGEGNGIPLGGLAGIELICDQSSEGSRRKMFVAALNWDAAVDLHTKLGEMIAKGRD